MPADAPQQPNAHHQHALGPLGQRPGARPAAGGSRLTDWEARCAYGSNGRPLEAHKQWCALLSLQGGLGNECLPGKARHVSPCGASGLVWSTLNALKLPAETGRPHRAVGKRLLQKDHFCPIGCCWVCVQLPSQKKVLAVH